jgi:hypothetical protein
MAAAIVVSIPVVAGFLTLQRYLVQGLTAGGVKQEKPIRREKRRYHSMFEQ